MSTLVLIPTYNERANVQPLAQALHEQLPDADLLFLDDASPDGTGDRLNALRKTHPYIHVCARPGKSGLGRAYLDGFRWSLTREYTQNICMDADFSHAPEATPQLLAGLANADLVCGSRYLPSGKIVHWPKPRLWLSRSAGVYTRLITGMPHSDPTGGFHALSRKALETLPLDQIRSDGYAFQIELKHRLWMSGLPFQEVPITFTERQEGNSKMNGAIVREAVGEVWRLAARVNFRRTPPPLPPPLPPPSQRSPT